MATDGARHRIVLFGGAGATTGNGYYGDTWLWDGNSWTKAADTGPSARSQMAMAYDSDRERVVLSSGATSSAINDTWEWDGLTWTLRATWAPFLPMMAYDQNRKRTVALETSSGATWEWDGSQWNQMASSGPAVERGAMAFNPLRGTVVFFGGANNQLHFSSATWEWDGTSWTEYDISGPPARRGHLMCFDAARANVVLFGGFNDLTMTTFGETWTLTR
jgi:hypothetical protein